MQLKKKISKRANLSKKTQLLLVVICLCLLMLTIGVIRNATKAPSVDTSSQIATNIVPKAEEKPDVIHGMPAEIIIEKLNLKLEVLVGDYNRNQQDWTLNDHNAFFVRDSVVPNNYTGISIFYGHNTKQVFGLTSQLQKGDQLKLKLASGVTFLYEFNQQKLVKPTDQTALNVASDKPQIMLMSCHGLLDEQRRLMYFDFVESNES